MSLSENDYEEIFFVEEEEDDLFADVPDATKRRVPTLRLESTLLPDDMGRNTLLRCQ